MLVKLVSTVTPAYLITGLTRFLAGASSSVVARVRLNLLEKLEEGALGEDNVGIVPVEHACESRPRKKIVQGGVG